MYEIDPSDFVRVTKFIKHKILNENEGTEFSHFFLTSYLNELKGGIEQSHSWFRNFYQKLLSVMLG